jgi:sugar lactone lactonase YvrE
MNKVELLDDCKNSLGEGITFSSTNNFLYWLDIGNISKLHKLDLSSNKKKFLNYQKLLPPHL